MRLCPALLSPFDLLRVHAEYLRRIAWGIAPTTSSSTAHTFLRQPDVYDTTLFLNLFSFFNHLLSGEKNRGEVDPIRHTYAPYSYLNTRPKHSFRRHGPPTGRGRGRVLVISSAARTLPTHASRTGSASKTRFLACRSTSDSSATCLPPNSGARLARRSARY